ncbi:linear amide C-N hydrolase [Allorhodopirellula solitaria]|uniref:Choloylglycine hydrolase/NAAA C-terminal domain-containing protein n=1 Tax=Allorhodopirellula solitaria TaxID=2527987 RepID=A0A5C5XVK4_9BACT|nr:linear amide C-N hydrolase [Allorhodopirellula solitaria]TWT67347.1 hypothetical protein CA85_21970 [Allorhodopirellula solitaria]
MTNHFSMLGAILGLACSLVVSDPLAACTVMRLQRGEDVVIARNHDWGTDGGLLIVNPRGIDKTAISPVQPHRWVSQYGSVSFAQFGRELSFAGMNERGLTVDLLQLRAAAFPAADAGKPTVNAVQWVQYQLDTAATVADVVVSLDQINPMPFLAMLEKVHYFVTDTSGDVAVIEYLDGKLHVHRGGEGVCALANSTWEDSSRAIAADHASNSSEQRFMRSSYLVTNAGKQPDDVDLVDYAFAGLNKVAQDHTQWSLVYQPEAMRVNFATRAAPKRRWIEFTDLDFNEGAELLCLDINADLAGDVIEHLEPFTKEANRRIIDDAFNAGHAGMLRDTVKEMVLNYGENLTPVGVD